jgi:hypothetical protein
LILFKDKTSKKTTNNVKKTIASTTNNKRPRINMMTDNVDREENNEGDIDNDEIQFLGSMYYDISM